MTHQLEDLEKAGNAVREFTSPRAKWMSKLEQFVAGTQYQGLPDYFTADVPLWERAPCIVDAVVKSAIDSNSDLCLGEGRFPTVTIRPAEADDDLDDSLLSEDESALLDRFVEIVHRQVRFETLCREVFASGQGCGSAAAIFGVRAGKLFADTTRAKWCTPTLDACGVVTSLTIEYAYVDHRKQQNGKTKAVALAYRRVIDAEKDTTFLPVELNDNGAPMGGWKADASQTFVHGLGFCPVVWYPHMLGCEAVNRFDGHAIHENLLDELRAHDMALSMRHRAALFAGDPQWVEIGVKPGYNPSGDGREAMIPTTAKGGPASATNPIEGFYRSKGTDSAPRRKKGPGQIWQYGDPNTKVELITLPEGALKAIDDHAHDLRVKLSEALGVVNLDPDNLKFAATTSGAALRVLKGRQTDKCDQYRSDFGDRFVLPATSMLLRICHVTNKRGATLRVPGIAKLAPVLAKFDVPDEVSEVSDVA